MKIQRQNIDVGQFFVVGLNMQNEEAHIVRYWKLYEDALRDAQEKWYESRDKGFVYLVLEVQGLVASQGVPNLTTKLTEKL